MNIFKSFASLLICDIIDYNKQYEDYNNILEYIRNRHLFKIFTTKRVYTPIYA